MAQVISGNQVKLNSGKVINAEQGGWYDAQQFWGGTLSAPGVINTQSNQQGAGQAVSKEVIQQTNPANWAYIQQQQKTYQPSATSQALPGSEASSTSGVDFGFEQQDLFDPVKFYESAYANSGIRDIEADLASKQTAYNEQVAKIKDNPYLSEATMTGRIKKLDEKFSADQLAIQNRIATKKADVETQLNLQLKKLDINSAAATQALNKFNTLLSAGALQGASGQDIANITRATGISSSMIQSAITAQNKKNNPVSVSTFTAENGEVFAVALDASGNMVNKQSLGVIGNVQGKTTSTKAEDTQQTQANFIQDVKAGIIPRELVPRYGISGGLSVEEIYRLYNSYSPWGPAQESLDEFKEGRFVS